MKLWMPMLGDAMVLTEDWHFMLHGEYRNFDLFKAEDPNLALDSWRVGRCSAQRMMLPKGTELVFDRIYVVDSADGFANITFLIKRHPSSARHFGCRFWTSLERVNEIECERTNTGNPIGPAAKAHYRTLALPDDERIVKQARIQRSKSNKEDLKLIRDEFVRKLASMPKDTSSNARRLNELVNRISADKRDDRHIDGARVYVLNGITASWVPERRWQVSSTRKAGDLTIRSFTYHHRWWNEVMGVSSHYDLPGFTVTSCEGRITKIEPTEEKEKDES